MIDDESKKQKLLTENTSGKKLYYE